MNFFNKLSRSKKLDENKIHSLFICFPNYLFSYCLINFVKLENNGKKSLGLIICWMSFQSVGFLFDGIIFLYPSTL